MAVNPRQRRYWDPDDSDDDINISMVSKTSHSALPFPAMATPAPKVMARIPSGADPFKPLSLKFGDTSEKGSVFVPFKLVKRFPRTNIGQSKQGPAIQFFSDTLLRDRVWDFFSLGDPNGRREPLLLVPTVQFEKYLDIASQELNGGFTIPRGGPSDQFNLTFGELDTPRPRFLGRANDVGALAALKQRANSLPPEDLYNLSPACKRTYLDKMDKLYELLHLSKSKVKKQEAAKQRKIQRQKNSGRMLKRVQRYLGLRRPSQHMLNYDDLSNDPNLVSWNICKAAPFRPQESVRFVCVDIEAYEKDTRLVTEVGLAVLDTKHATDICPGEGGENWFPLIQAHHLRIIERRHLMNSEFVKGCPEAFNFGESQMVCKKDISKVVGELISAAENKDQRQVVLVGHDLKQDLKYLLSIGYNPWCVPQIVDEVDTMSMYQRIEQSPNGRGLAKVCADLGFSGRNYHNGGNDAVYTLRAMISMAIKRTVEDSGGKMMVDISSKAGEDDANVGEWSDGDNDDGDLPQRSSPPTPKRNRQTRESQW
ncbi:hypothetical protein F4808DRAFT_83584 [Astrocystis sublimbata]|nr:hypothetical protein F4808DRAFT_83584 [Astrocystis sublimbata]